MMCSWAARDASCPRPAARESECYCAVLSDGRKRMTFRNGLSSLIRAVSLLAFAATVHATTYVGVFMDHASIPAGGTAAFDMQLRENDGAAFTNGAITVTYPAGLVNDGQY